MMMVATTPFSALLVLFVAVPLGIMIGIYGGEGVQRYRRTRRH